MTSTICGCSWKRSGIFSKPRRTSSRLISLPVTMSGMVGKRRCTSRKTWLSTVPSPMPASNRRKAGGVGLRCSSSSPTRSAITHFSPQVMTNSRYFCRLS